MDDDDSWDDDFAEGLIGQTLLLGLLYFEYDGTLRERRQVFGVVESVHRVAGIAIREEKSGEIFVAAPVLDAIEHGTPGVYQLSDDDDEIVDPDFTARISITAPLRS